MDHIEKKRFLIVFFIVYTISNVFVNDRTCKILLFWAFATITEDLNDSFSLALLKFEDLFETHCLKLPPKWHLKQSFMPFVKKRLKCGNFKLFQLSRLTVETGFRLYVINDECPDGIKNCALSVSIFTYFFFHFMKWNLENLLFELNQLFSVFLWKLVNFRKQNWIFVSLWLPSGLIDQSERRLWRMNESPYFSWILHVPRAEDLRANLKADS